MAMFGMWISTLVTPARAAESSPPKPSLAVGSQAGDAKKPALTLRGRIESGGTGLAGYTVSLYASFVDHGLPWEFLGSGRSDGAGNFQITYTVPPGLINDRQPLLFVRAERGAVLLASAIGKGTGAVDAIVVNERTTVATGNAFAQFIDGGKIAGNTYGMINAARMAANLADPRTGAAGVVLASIPNGVFTSTYATFNSLSNVVASCVAEGCCRRRQSI